MGLRTLSVLLVASSFAIPALAQTMHFATDSHKADVASSSSGRDFRFAMPENLSDQSGKYIALYVSSQTRTIAHVQLTGAVITSLPVSPSQVSTFMIPISWEIKTSGQAENKAVHLWSDDADLTVYCMSHTPYSSDGTQILPVIAWGNDYVVAAYGALYESTSFDYPSEFTVVAASDNTILTITPTQDIRGATSTTTLHKKGIPFTETLQAGQAIQYQTTLAYDADNYDVTGTVVHSTKPVGIIGASQCPNIPSDFPYCDHVCEMIPPIRLWGTKYYTAPFATRKGGNTFLVIASSDNQTIFTEDATTGKHVYAILAKQGDIFWRPDVEYATAWSSAQPFLLMEYVNSATWPDNMTGQGDPAMMSVPPVESYTNKVSIETPPSIGSVTPYVNYLTIATAHSGVHSVRVDGTPLTANGKLQSVDGKVDVYLLVAVKPGVHTITGDSGIGVMEYGYGLDESYAWSMNQSGFQTFTPSTDTTPPTISFTGDCVGTIQILDTEAGASGLYSVYLDSATNMALSIDKSFVPGSGVATTSATVYPIYPSYGGLFDGSVYDKAGNRLAIHVWYSAPIISFVADSLTFAGASHDTTIVRPLMIANTGTLPFDMSTSRIVDPGVSPFVILSGSRPILQPGERDTIIVQFKGDLYAVTNSKLLVGGSCITDTIPLTMRPKTNSNLIADDIVFSNTPVGDSSIASTVINDVGTSTLTVDSISTDNSSFVFEPLVGGNSLPFQVPVGLGKRVWFAFFPKTSGPTYGTAYINSPETGQFTIKLSGNISTGGVHTTADGNTSFLSVGANPNPIGLTSAKKLVLSLSGIPVAEYTAGLYDLLGRELRHAQAVTGYDGTSSVSFDVKDLPAGSYLFRVESVGEVRSGRVVIE